MFEKLLTLYPSLTLEDFKPFVGTIVLQNDNDGKGDYIKEWNCKLPKPSIDQLKDN